MATHRVSRGRESQKFVADYLHSVFPEAESIAASLPGRDILKTPGWAIEVKATEKFSPTEFLAQADRNCGEDIPLVVYRPRGYGREKMAKWVVVMSLERVRSLIEYIQALEDVNARLANLPNSADPAPLRS